MPGQQGHHLFHRLPQQGGSRRLHHGLQHGAAHSPRQLLLRSALEGKAQTLLAFDYGTRKIGVAVGQTITGSATPLPELKARDGAPDWAAIGKLLNQWKPDACVETGRAHGCTPVACKWRRPAPSGKE